MVAQLLASEGFANVEEIAFVDLDELAAIEGFDAETAEELQTRAREHLEKIDSEQDEERKALGVADELKDVPGVTTAMMVALGKNDIKTLEDLAYCAADDLVGWSERKDGETTRFEGALSGIEISRAEAEAIIMTARLKAGIVTEADLAPKAEAPQEEPAIV
jgi:transcription termination/antitermination protein NusA